jgi:hypothetical protein
LELTQKLRPKPAKPFVPEKSELDVWHDMGNLAQDGTRVRVMFLSTGGMVVQRILDPAIFRAVAEQARHERDIHRKGTMIGHTQRHWRKIGSLPAAMHAQWKDELGPVADNPKAWKKRWNDGELAVLRSSEGRV